MTFRRLFITLLYFSDLLTRILKCFPLVVRLSGYYFQPGLYIVLPES